MAGIETADIADLVNATLSKYATNFLADAATDLRDFPAAEKLWDKRRQKADWSGGKDFRWDVLYKGDSNFRAVGYFEVDNTNQEDGTVEATVPWRFVNTSATFDVKQVSVNDAPQKIYDFVKSKEVMAWVGWFNGLEQYFWDGPSGSTDKKIPYGLLNYWLAYNASTGFYGGNHTNWASGPGGIDCDDANYANWKHYTFDYENVSDEDAVLKLRTAILSTRFRGIPNKPIADGSYSDMDEEAFYTVLPNIISLGTLAESKDDRVGRDLGKYDGMVTVARTPVIEVPYLTANHATSAPFIGIKWKQVKVPHPAGQWFREHPYEKSPLQHDSRVKQIDASRQIALVNRRQFVLGAKSDPLSD